MKKIIKIAAGILTIGALCLGVFWVYLWHNYEVPILMYHTLDASRVNNYAAVSPQHFYEQMAFIKKRGYRVIPLEDYCRMVVNRQTYAHNLVVITFDDGFGDNLQAAEILRKFDFPATIFLVADKIGTDMHLSAEDIRTILSNSRVGIGSHTLTHRSLDTLGSEALKHEIAGSKEKLRSTFEREITTITYPGGGYNNETIEVVRDAGYLCACTTNRGFSRTRELFALRRIKITDRDTEFSLWAKLSGFYNLFRRLRKP
ncbi:MAG: polysaccharide deacetylase family protein, partial [Candidatus Omnitrophica bacterium]|nr:polysaccharide deacetylase family protein [Candidatus Omnitrophota bacterium]